MCSSWIPGTRARLRPCGAWLCSCLDRRESADVHCKLCGSKLCFHASVCALADTAFGLRDQSPVLKTGQVVEATVPSFPQCSCQSLACAHGTDASVFRACARRTHIDRFAICFSGQVNAVKTGHLGLTPYLQVGHCNGSVFRTRLVLCVSCVWTNFPKCHTAESNWER